MVNNSGALLLSAHCSSSRHQPIQILLNLHEIAHPHTGDMLAEKFLHTLATWGIVASKVLAVITDNGSNMVKAIRLTYDLIQIREEEVDEKGQE